MTRRLCLALAVLAGLSAALLVVWNPTAHYQGRSATCDTVIVAAAVRDPVAAQRPTGPHAAVQRQLAASCHDKRVQLTAFAGLGVLLCVAFGSVVVFGGRPGPIASPRGGWIAPTPTC